MQSTILKLLRWFIASLCIFAFVSAIPLKEKNNADLYPLITNCIEEVLCAKYESPDGKFTFRHFKHWVVKTNTDGIIELSPEKWEEYRYMAATIEQWIPAITIESHRQNSYAQGLQTKNLQGFKLGNLWLSIKGDNYAQYNTVVCGLANKRGELYCLTVSLNTSYLNKYGRNSSDDLAQYILLLGSITNS